MLGVLGAVAPAADADRISDDGSKIRGARHPTTGKACLLSSSNGDMTHYALTTKPSEGDLFRPGETILAGCVTERREQQGQCPRRVISRRGALTSEGDGRGGLGRPLRKAPSGAGPPATRMANHEGVGRWEAENGSSSQNHHRSQSPTALLGSPLPFCPVALLHFARRPDSTSASDNPQSKSANKCPDTSRTLTS